MSQSPAQMLTTIGTALYGAHWRKPLADALDVDERQMRRWINESDARLDPAHGIFADALAIMTQRAREIAGAAKALERWRSR